MGFGTVQHPMIPLENQLITRHHEGHERLSGRHFRMGLGQPQARGHTVMPVGNVEGFDVRSGFCNTVCGVGLLRATGNVGQHLLS